MPAQPSSLLQLVQTIALPDVRGRIDHLDIDLDGGRLFVAALGNNSVEVIDLRAGRRSARLEHLREPQGVAYAPEAKRLFVANGESGRVDVFAGDTLSPVGHVDALEDADNIRYEPASGRIYVGYGIALAVLEAPTMQLVSRIKLAGHPESLQLDDTGSRIFVNVPMHSRSPSSIGRRECGGPLGS
jgi:DNA-binding beta-propeller fold protein YncE